MGDYLEDAKFASSNNPAGRVIQCLAPVISRGSNAAVADSLAHALGVEASDLSFPGLCAAIRIEAYSVREEIAPYLLTMRGARRSFEDFDTVIAAADALLLPNSTSEIGLRQTISAKGWSALCWADEILSADSHTSAVAQDAAANLLKKVREVIDDVLNSDAFSEDEKRHMVGLLRDLEDALIGVRVRGSGPVDRAAKAVMGDALARPDLWNRDGGRKRRLVLKRIVDVVAAVTMLLGAYPGGKELVGDLFPQLAIAAAAEPAVQADDPVSGPVPVESEGPPQPR